MDYILGTHDAEIARLGIQHRAWRDRVQALWRQAGFGPGNTVLDIGSGPGFAAIDLAEMVGSEGRVLAIDQSRRFLDVLEAACRQRGVNRLQTHQLDLDTSSLPFVAADGAWCRWVLAFLKRPQDVVQQLARVIRPGGVFAVHEYFDYATWRTAPRLPELEEFVHAVMESWRASGGEPDVGLDLPQWLDDAGFDLRQVRPIVEIVPAAHSMWLWLRTFFEVGRARLCEIGVMTPDRADTLWQRFTALEATPGTLMITPGVLEIVAVRR